MYTPTCSGTVQGKDFAASLCGMTEEPHHRIPSEFYKHANFFADTHLMPSVHCELDTEINSLYGA